MDDVVKGMVRIYHCTDIDWLGYKITRHNPLTYHHIQKAEDKGQRTFSNGGLLTVIGHGYLHIIEYREIQLYLRLNDMLRIINQQGHAPTLEQYKIINDCLEEFEKQHAGDRNNKGKRLIKQEYYQRKIYNY